MIIKKCPKCLHTYDDSWEVCLYCRSVLDEIRDNKMIYKCIKHGIFWVPIGEDPICEHCGDRMIKYEGKIQSKTKSICFSSRLLWMTGYFFNVLTITAFMIIGVLLALLELKIGIIFLLIGWFFIILFGIMGSKK